MIEITILIDNLTNPALTDLQAEHALSLLIKTEQKSILCDMGASATFITNAESLGVELSNLDFAFLSHGHADHSGGLGEFLQVNDNCPVILRPELFRQRYYSSRRGAKRDISTDSSLLHRYGHRFITITESRWIAPDIAVVSNIEDQYPKPYGNRFLTMDDGSEEHPDTFTHELSLALCTKQGLVIVSSCSHGGALNIIKSCQRFTGVERVATFVGGLHFVDSDEAEHETRSFIEQWRREHPDMRVYTGHCTGNIARTILAEEAQATMFYTGAMLLLP